MESIDLTSEPAGDEALAHARRPKQTPVPLPENVRHIFEDAASTSRLRQSPAPLLENVRRPGMIGPSPMHLSRATNGPSPHMSPYTTPSADSSRPASAKAADASIGRVGKHQQQSAYMPVYPGSRTEIEGGTSGAKKAEKRRKLSVPGEHRSLGSQARQLLQDSRQSVNNTQSGPSKSSGAAPRIIGNGDGQYGVARIGVPNVNTGARLQAMNGVPTVHSLNSALKTNGARTGISSEVLGTEGRTLHIGRALEDGEAVSRQGSTVPILHKDPAVEHRNHSVLGAEVGMPTLEDSEWNEAASALSSFQPRTSPLKKRRLNPPPAAETESERQPTVEQADSIGISNFLGDVMARHVPVGNPSQPDFRVPPSLPQQDQVPEKTEKRGKPGKKTGPRQFSTEEDHLLIFLKEVKKFRWPQIMPHFPNRSAGVLQSRFCVYLNRRDRSRDPPRLNLPPEFAAEAVIDWNSVHGLRVDRTALTASPSETSAFTPTAVPAAVPTAISIAASGEPSPRRRRGRPRKDEQVFPLTMQTPVPRRDQPGRQEQPVTYLPTHDTYSGNENNMRHPHKRPRRNVQVVDYTWPRRHLVAHELAVSADDDSVIQDSRRSSLPLGSLEPSEAPSNVPDTVVPVEKAMEMDFIQEDARIVTSEDNLPYLSRTQQSMLNGNKNSGEWDQLGSREWQGTVVHIDFSHDERDIVERVAKSIVRSSQTPQPSSQRKRLQKLLRDQPESKLVNIAYEIRRMLPSRDRPSVDAFLEDARKGKLSRIPQILRLGAARFDPRFTSKDKSSLVSRISQREIGLQSKRGWKTASRPLSYQTKNKVYDTMGPAYSFTGASSDVHTVAWSPDGQYFAAGAVCVTDPDSMQYNRRDNLLYGDLHTKTIQELAEHRVDRPILETGPNSTHAMRVSQDRKLYTTVSAVAFSPGGDYVFSAGYDKNVCIWETQKDGTQPVLSHALKHRAEVDLLAVSCNGKLATASKRWERAIKVISAFDQDEIEKASYASRKADERPDQNILPTALQFEPNHGRLLLAGFGANKRHDRMDISGDICLWDVETQQELHVHGSTKNVFDATFNPNQIEQPLFAVGCVAGANVNRGTRSLVRFYDGRGWGKYTMNMEVECPALDINDVRFCPYDENLVAAGCTSGRTYIWDIRRPDTFLYKLAHGKSLMPLDDYIDPEITDTGIRFLSWGENAHRLYTGSSDGVVKVWDVACPQGEVFIKDLITVDSGIMSGAFSPDFSRLVVGEVNGSVNVLEVGKDDFMVKDMERLKHVPYEEATADSEPDSAPVMEDYDSGRAIAAKLLLSKQMINVTMGGLPMRQAVQGPNYAGPFDSSVYAPYLREQALDFQYNISRTLGSQCNIPTCKDSFVKVTSEEIGDSGRSLDRIPDELRKQWKLVGSDLTVIPGKSKCANCGRPARPTDTTLAIDTDPLCERCSFACFRCGGSIRMDPATEKLVCRSCLRAWQIGALGYECVDDNGSKVLSADVPALTGFQKELDKETGAFLAWDVSFGDEMNALTDHYFSLAIDRPESPSL